MSTNLVKAPKTYKSAYHRLLAMPEVFTGITFARLNNLDDQTAAVYLTRMKKAELVDSFNGRGKVYFNLVKNIDAKQDNLFHGLLMIHRSAILRGESVLHSTGWITQIPTRTSIAILETKTYIDLKEFDIVIRKGSWYGLLGADLIKPDKAKFSTYGLPALPPELALADLYLDAKGWHPDPDDLHIEDEDWRKVDKAFQKLGIDIPEKYREMIAEASHADNDTACFH